MPLHAFAYLLFALALATLLPMQFYALGRSKARILRVPEPGTVEFYGIKYRDRDRIAEAALPQFIAQEGLHANSLDIDYDRVAHAAYQMADAMLVARSSSLF